MGEGVAPIYVDLACESNDPHVTMVSSLCMACQEMGTTRLLMTRIPHYKEVVLTSFECSHCGNHNTECQASGVAERGVTYRLEVRDSSDLTRQVVRSNHATIQVPELELEIPASSKKSEVTTVEGLLNQTQEGLTRDQGARRLEQPQVADQIDAFLDRLTSYLTLTSPFTLIIDDPSGSSFVENPLAPKLDPKLSKKVYRRTPEQNSALGLAQEEGGARIQEEVEVLRITDKEGLTGEAKKRVERIEEENEEVVECEMNGKEEEKKKKPEGSEEKDRAEKEKETREEQDKRKEDTAGDEKNRKVEEVQKLSEEKSGKGDDKAEISKDEVLVFSTLCDRCYRPTTTNMKVVQIPYFKEVIIMAQHCEGCGYRTNEVKSGAGVGEKGRRITLKLTHPSDLTRDVLKSDTCEVLIPELDLSVGGGLIVSKFTTLEGLLKDMREDLATNPFLAGDSAQQQSKKILDTLLDNLDKILAGEMKVTFILDDPAGNSFLQNLYAPDPDPNMTCEEYIRTREQNDDLGLTHMKTENYAEEGLKEQQQQEEGEAA